MRNVARPFLFFCLLCGVAEFSWSQTAPGGGVNQLFFTKGSPMPMEGGVTVSVAQKATTGYTCLYVTIRVIDNATGKTLDTFTVENPRGDVRSAFTGLGSNKEIQVTVDATFQSQTMSEAKFIETVVTTQ